MNRVYLLSVCHAVPNQDGSAGVAVGVDPCKGKGGENPNGRDSLSRRDQASKPILPGLRRFSGKCDHVCVGNDSCACMKGYKLRPDGRSCEGKRPRQLMLKMKTGADRRAALLSGSDGIKRRVSPWFLRHQRVPAGIQHLSGGRALHQHRGFVPLHERGQLRDRLRAHRKQRLQRSAACVLFGAFSLLFFVFFFIAGAHI